MVSELWQLLPNLQTTLQGAPLKLCLGGECSVATEPFAVDAEHVHLLVNEPESGRLVKLRPKTGNACRFLSYLPLTFMQTLS
jgi:hypothetical protein